MNQCLYVDLWDLYCMLIQLYFDLGDCVVIDVVMLINVLVIIQVIMGDYQYYVDMFEVIVLYFIFEDVW